MADPEDMWQCQTVNCGYIYNPDKGDRKGGIPKNTKFEDLPEDWKCPVCGAGKHLFNNFHEMILRSVNHRRHIMKYKTKMLCPLEQK